MDLAESKLGKLKTQYTHICGTQIKRFKLESGSNLLNLRDLNCDGDCFAR